MINNLTRTDCVLQVGGFNEHMTAEDTALSLMLSAKGYTVKLVDVLSYDTEPQDVFRYARRTVRWARQAVDLFRLPWRSAAFRLKLLLCYHLYGNLIHNVYLGLLLLVAWTPFRTANVDSLYNSVAFVVANRLYLTPWFAVLLGMTGLWVVQFILRLVLARKAGVSTYAFLLFSLLSTLLMYFVAFRVTIAMLRTALGFRTFFVPTNTQISEAPTLRTIANHMLPSLVYGALVVVGIGLQNRYLLLSLNCLWILLLLAAPLLLWLFHAKVRISYPKESADNGL